MLAFPDGNENLVPIELIDDTREDRTVQGLSDVIEASTMTPFALACGCSTQPRHSEGGGLSTSCAREMWREWCAQLRVSTLRRRSKLRVSCPLELTKTVPSAGDPLVEVPIHLGQPINAL
jgi:hypothetical protein